MIRLSKEWWRCVARSYEPPVALQNHLDSVLPRLLPFVSAYAAAPGGIAKNGVAQEEPSDDGEGVGEGWFALGVPRAGGEAGHQRAAAAVDAPGQLEAGEAATGSPSIFDSFPDG